MLVLIFDGKTEKCRFTPRELNLDAGYLITPPRTRPWPVVPGNKIQQGDGKVIGQVTARRRGQFQRCRLDFVVPRAKKAPVKKRAALPPIPSEVAALDAQENPHLAALPVSIVVVLLAQGIEADADIEAKLDEGDVAVLALRGIGPKALEEIKAAFGRSE